MKYDCAICNQTCAPVDDVDSESVARHIKNQRYALVCGECYKSNFIPDQTWFVPQDIVKRLLDDAHKT